MKRVLFVSEINPFSKCDTGGMSGGIKNYNALVRYYGENNVFLAIVSNNRSIEKDNLFYLNKHKSKQEYFLNTIFLWNCYNRRVHKEIIQLIAKLDIQYVFWDTSIWGRTVKAISKLGSVKQFVYFHNVEKDYAYLLFKNKGFLYFPQYLSYRYNEQLSSRYADSVIALNERDARLITQNYGISVSGCVPVTYIDRFKEYSIVAEDHYPQTIKLLFVGSSELTANVDGITWFINTVFSHLDSSTFCLEIIGKGFEVYTSALSRPGVKVIGSVSTTDDYYYQADIVVEPIQYGTGMKTKTAEAMMFGKTILATNEALEGYDISNLNEVFRCNSPDDFIQTLLTLSKSTVKKYNPNVRSTFLQNYEESCTAQKYKNIFQAL